MNNSYQQIKDNILTDEKTAIAVEYMLSKAISSGISSTVKFIYKKHKIIKDKKKLYSIYRLEDGIKLYSKIKYQDIAKYIIDNLNNPSKINNIIEVESNISRIKNKIELMKLQHKLFKNKEILEDKIQASYVFYNNYKRELFKLIGKNNIC